MQEVYEKFDGCKLKRINMNIITTSDTSPSTSAITYCGIFLSHLAYIGKIAFVGC